MFRLGQRFATVIVQQHRGKPTFHLPITAIRLFDILSHDSSIKNHKRLYSTKNDDAGKSRGGLTPCESAKRNTPKGGECKPREDRMPCSPISRECKKIPSIDDCKRENLLAECLKPVCPYDENSSFLQKHYRKIVILGLLLATAAVGLMFYLGSRPAPKKKRKKAQIKRRSGVVIKDPLNSDFIPKEVQYLIIGGGTAAFAAFRSIKSIDPTAQILIVTSEPHKPYMRPPLSKEMWLTTDKNMQGKMEFTQWNGKVRSMYYEPDAFYMGIGELASTPNGGVSVASGWRVDKVDIVGKTAHLEDGATIKYDKCLLATGAKPKVMEVLANIDEEVADRVNVFRTMDDFNCLRDNLAHAKSIAIIGGGFLGTELACAIARFGEPNNLEVLQIFKEVGVLAKILPEYLSMWVSGKVRDEGVELIPQAVVTEAIADGAQIQLTLSTNVKVTVDEVLVCIGMQPNTQFAESSLLEVDPTLGGFLVNAELQARTDHWAAGDVASFYDTAYGRRRLEHHDNSVVTGRIAGENMTGAAKPYTHQSMYWSDMGRNIGFEAIGTVDSTLPTVGVFIKTPEKAGDANSNKGGNEEEVQFQDGGRVESTHIPEECEKYASQAIVEAQRKSLAKEREKGSMEKDNEDFGKGIVFYLKDDVVVGMVLWNVFHRMGIARQVLADQRKYEDLNEVAKLFKIHED